MMVGSFIPDFAVTAAYQHHPAWIDHPLILTHETAKKSLVFAASIRAQWAGIRTGMGLARAQALCPDAVVLPVVHTRLQQAADRLLEHLAPFSNRLEITFKDTALLWVDAGTQNTTEALRISHELHDQVRAVIPCTVMTGIAANKFTAQIAAVTAEGGQVQTVAPGQEAAFLAAFPLSRLALGGPLIHQFRLLGLTTLGQFAALPREAVYERFGTVGRQLYARAQGIDPRPVAAYTPRRTETWTQAFEPSVDDRHILEHSLRDAAGTLAERLKPQNLAAGEIILLVHLEQRHTLELRQQPREAALSVFALSTELLRLLKGVTITGPVTGLEVVLADLHEPLPYQLDLFGTFFGDASNIETISHRLHRHHETTGLYRVRSAAHAGYVPEHEFILERIAGP
jgi:DNA polymerase-4